MRSNLSEYRKIKMAALEPKEWYKRMRLPKTLKGWMLRITGNIFVVAVLFLFYYIYFTLMG